MRYSRQNKIIEIITNQDVDTQERLASLLRESGFEVTQATISRDIKELQLVKTLSSRGKYKYAISNSKDLPVTDRFIKIFRETVLSIKSAGNIILIKTLAGCANAAGEAIDTSGVKHVVGSVAGDNTLMVLVDGAEFVPEILDEFEKILLYEVRND